MSLPSREPAEMNRSRLIRRIGLGVGLAIAVVTALALFADVQELRGAFQGFAWWLLGPVLVLTLNNYLLRFVKWHIYLHALGLPGIAVGTSALIFLSGFSMSVTPGKVGELIKGIYLRRLTGLPLSQSAAVIAAERLTDGLAMLCLAGLGLTQFAYGRPLLTAAALGAIVALALLRRPALLRRLIRRLEDLPGIGGQLHHARAFLDVSHTLYRPKLLLAAVALGIVSWAGECVALYLVLTGLGLPGSWRLLLVATFALSVSSIVGALSIAPGGLGVAEASIAGILLLLVPATAMTPAVAVAATLLIRFATLWFAVLLGVLALAALEHRFGQLTALRGESHPVPET